MTVRGGQKLARFLRKAKRAKSVRSIEVGFFESSRYPSGEYVAAVAAWNEFGTENEAGETHIPERPFFRNAIAGAKEDLLPILIENVDPRTMAVDRKTAGLMGQAMVGRIQRSITTLRTPELAESTKRAKGSSNPLIDTSLMRKSTTYKIDE